MSSFASWLTRLKENVIRPSRRTNRPARRKSFQLQVEELEPRLAPASSFSVLAAFEGSLLTGANPAAGMIRDASGNLFGTTTAGGTSNDGSVFEISNGTPKTLYSFSGSDGSAPYGNLVEDTATGDLFGTTSAGGTGSGTVFDLKPNGTLTTIYAFSGSDGAFPRSGLVRDASGNLFGTTELGGANNDGTVFELVAPATSGGTYTLKTLYTFGTVSGDGANPYAGVIEDGSGNLFGTTQAGGAHGDGTIFEWVNSSSTLNTLYSFGTTTGDGANPFAGLIEDASGNLFGTTGLGGSGSGTVFELPSGSSTLKTLYTFGTTTGDGAKPAAGLFEDANGNLFGTTQTGGSGDGTVFELANNSGSYTLSTLHSFTSASDGANPQGSLVADSKGNLYGTAFAGGANSAGTVFEVATPQKIVLSSGNMQQGVAGSQLPIPLAVQVTDSQGNPVSGFTVNWAVASGGGAVSTATSVTDSTGIATINAALGTTAGTNNNTYTATVNGLSGSPVTFTETATAGPAVTIAKAATNNGDGQSGTVGSQLTNPLVVKVTDENGNPIQGKIVTWAVATGGGSVSQFTTATDSSGQASVKATLGTTAGSNTYTATVSGLSGSPVTFTETGNAGTATSIAVSSGNNQTGGPGTQLTNPLAILVTDQFGNPVSGTIVNWTALTSGGSVSAATSTTGSNGIATITATLGVNTGSNTFTATVSGLTGSPVTFTETAQSASAIISGEAVGLQGDVLGGLNINLVGTTTSGKPVNLNATTNADGFYSFLNLLPGTYQLQSGQTFVNSPGATVTLADGQVVNQDVAFTSYATEDISLRLFLNTTNFIGFTSVQSNQPIVVNPIQNVSVAAGASPTVINLAGNFTQADMTNPVIQLDTSEGTVDLQLFGKLAPQTVANFLSYVESGSYNQTIIHRVQVIANNNGLGIDQGGAFSLQTDPTTGAVTGFNSVTQDPAVANEFGVSNAPGTISMGLLSGQPNSGTNSFFFNVSDNSQSLDAQKFTVFGKILTAADQTVISNINAVPNYNLTASPSSSSPANGAFGNIPLTGYTNPPITTAVPANTSTPPSSTPSDANFPGDTTAANYIKVNSAKVITPSASQLTYAIVSNSNPALVSAVLGDKLTGFDSNLLTLNYTAGATGTAVITVQATNQNGVSVTTSFTVTVA